jgi:protein-tyrosine phosphatase
MKEDKNKPAASSAVDTACEAKFDIYWFKDGRLAGMSKPGVLQPLENDLCYLKKQKIRLLVSLTEEELPFEEDNWPFSYAHFSVEDFSAPTLEQLACFIELTEYMLARGERVAVHCLGGRGRTGTFLSAYFINQGMTVDEAVAHVRAVRPGSVETDSQMDTLTQFARLTAPKSSSKQFHSKPGRRHGHFKHRKARKPFFSKRCDDYIPKEITASRAKCGRKGKSKSWKSRIRSWMRDALEATKP